ncbi:family 78 glycoside hydrolase catalytic domain [bacterium]|nr:family 78 glycoside hydrolase catalytic domain [bacterium]
MKLKKCLPLFWLALNGVSLPAASNSLSITRMTCDYAVNPTGVENPHPVFSWILQSNGYNKRQTAFQIIAATDCRKLSPQKADLWNSGIVREAHSAHISYQGRALRSRQTGWWQVRVWDEQDRPSAWSRPAYWEMGLLQPSDWQALWIGSGPATEPRPERSFFQQQKEQSAFSDTVHMNGRSTLLRKAFRIDKPVRSARAYVCGLGYYELYCNGRRVGDQVLAPAKTNYRKWILYDILDLSQLLQSGENALGLILGNGWFNPYKKWWDPYRMQWFGSKRAILQLHIDYRDGSSQVIISDPDWKTAPGPVLFSCIYDGEVYDATQEPADWCQPGFDDSGWPHARVVEAPGGVLTHSLMPDIKVTQQLKPIALTFPAPGLAVYDLGQNFSGWVRMTCHGRRGERMTLRYAEDLQANGMLDFTSNEKALNTDVYVLNGAGNETYEPRFTFHGFRYVQVSGLDYLPSIDDLTGCVVHTAVDTLSTFSCSDELVNRIHRATLWSQRSNLMGYPMDCPQRDERLGWLGDAMVTMEEALINFDMGNFYRHWLDGLRLNQNPDDGDISIVSPRPYLPIEPDPTWSSAYLVMVWHFYLHYGDRGFLQHHYPAMRRYVEHLSTQAQEFILPKYWIGDWGSTAEGWKEGDPPLVGTAFYYYNAVILAKAAHVLEHDDEAQTYERLAENIRRALNKNFYNKEKHHYEPGSQFSNAFPLFLGLPDSMEQPAVLHNILSDIAGHDGHFTVGVLGAKYLIEALTQQQHADAAWRLITQKGYPSWQHLLAGRTTLSEFWNLQGSHNHVMLGSIDAWFFKTLAGIRADESRPGYEYILIDPFVPDALDSVQASVITPRGLVSVSWKKKNKVRVYAIEIPANTTARLSLPAAVSERIKAEPPCALARTHKDRITCEIGSGRYAFQVGSH